MKAALAALLLVASANAAGPSWSVARSAHFEVYATGSPSRAADALAMFETAHAFFTRYLSLPPSTRPPTRVLVFSGDKEYAPYRANASASAFYQPSRERDYIVMKDFNGDSFRIVAHEYAHAALGLKGADLPPWLGEGLAEFFSSVQLQGDKARLGLVPDGRLSALRRGGLMSVPELLAVGRNSPEYNEQDHAGLFYAESWALTHMLFADNRYRDGSSKFLSLAQQGKTSAEAFSEAYGKTPQEIDRDFRPYMRRDAFAFFTIDFPRIKSQAVAPTPVQTFDASLIVADMLSSQIGKDAETLVAFDALAAERPNDLGLIELRAFFALRTGGATAAEPLLRKAVEGGSQNASVLAQYAIGISETDPDRSSELLASALALAPDSAEIRIRAAAQLLRRQKPADALALIAAVAHVPSDLEFTYYQVVANGRSLLGDYPAADAAARRVAAAARTPEEMTFAATLLSTVGGPPEVSKMAEGRIKNLNCDGAMPILEVATSSGELRIAIDDPTHILIAGEPGAKLDLDCGAQDVPVRVGYSDVKPPEGTVGRLRFLDLRKK